MNVTISGDRGVATVWLTFDGSGFCSWVCIEEECSEEMDRVTYNGAVSNRTANGIGSLAYSDGVKIYEGTFSNGERHGSGVNFYRTGGKSYDGEFKDGWRHGSGQEYYEGGSVEYEGGWLRGERHGRGTLYEELSGDDDDSETELLVELAASRGLSNAGSKSELFARLEKSVDAPAASAANELRAWLRSKAPIRKGVAVRTWCWSQGIEVDNCFDSD